MSKKKKKSQFYNGLSHLAKYLGFQKDPVGLCKCFIRSWAKLQLSEPHPLRRDNRIIKGGSIGTKDNVCRVEFGLNKDQPPRATSPFSSSSNIPVNQFVFLSTRHPPPVFHH